MGEGHKNWCEQTQFNAHHYHATFARPFLNSDQVKTQILNLSQFTNASVMLPEHQRQSLQMLQW